MHQIFGYDSPIVSALTKIGDCICLSVLWLVFSLPVITMGAAASAAYGTAYCCIRKDKGRLWRNFWENFRGDFKRATLVWLVVLGVMALLTMDVFVFRSLRLSGHAMGNLYWLSLVLWCLGLTWAVNMAAYTARFTGTVGQTLRFGYLLLILHPIRALAVALILLAGLALVLLAPFLLLVVPAAVLVLCSFPLERIYLAHMRPEDKLKSAETEEPADDQ